MEVIRSKLDDIRIPNSSDKIYKDECIFGFETPESDEGLFICMKTFFGFGIKYVPLHYQRTSSRIYLNMKRIKIQSEPSDPGDGDAHPKKITKLAIGIEGGYNPSEDKSSYQEINSIVILPEFQRIPLPNLELPEKVLQCVSAILAAESASRVEALSASAGTWDGEKRQVSKLAANLTQLDNGVKVPLEGWKCEKCDLRDNLWLNLTDGAILCGRRFFDGSGGNNHMFEHNSTHKYPLIVKLGTTVVEDGKITADVYSYPENDMVEDPYLEKHLAHFGIDIKALKKTDKSMLELELDYNQRIGEWAIIQESDSKLIPIRGPGYTGIVNLGNSCYLNSVIQVLFSIPDFQKRYNDTNIFINASPDPTQELNVQMAKVAIGLLSGDYSSPINSTEGCIEQKGIKPWMLKNLIGKGHPEFSSNRQQDVQEFFLHLMNLIERNHQSTSTNPGDCLKFQVEERIECNQSHKVSYNFRTDFLLPLQVPLHKAINKEQVEEYEKKAASSSEKIDPVKSIVPLEACFDSLIEPEIIDDYFSTTLNQKTTASKLTKLKTFPDFLFLHIKKFTFDSNWQEKKLDISLQVPEILDLSKLRGKGPQPGEDILDEPAASPQQASPVLNIDPNHVSSIMEFGFSLNAAQRALLLTENSGVENAINWLLENSNNPILNDPLTERESSTPKRVETFVPDQTALDSLQNMGIPRDRATRALKETNNSVENAIEWIFSHEDVPMEAEPVQQPQPQPPQESSPGPAQESRPLRDGGEKYKLVAFISHMGSSPMCGHYICHILKEDKWIIFNDNKVAISQSAPKDLGYLYLYKRI
ncbi:ubiquitin specific protease 5 [Brevipalpus obovatus]|uniref:ubiquitin specific protease 5 n=1 Tax=Brevipalpus obovatus TaxID=246614 RepID=UPI003D9DD09E